jgi:hypothetical protein
MAIFAVSFVPQLAAGKLAARDDKFVAKWELSREISDSKANCHPEQRES